MNIIVGTFAMLLGLSFTAHAGDALDSVIKCESVKGGKKKGPDGSLFTVYLHSENNTRDLKIDVIKTAGKNGKPVSQPATLRFPSTEVKLVNSWADLNEVKAWFMLFKNGETDGEVIVYVKLKQKALDKTNASSEMVYKGEIESKSDADAKIYDKEASCLCGTVDKRDQSGNLDYSAWKKTACTPNSKDH